MCLRSGSQLSDTSTDYRPVGTDVLHTQVTRSGTTDLNLNPAGSTCTSEAVLLLFLQLYFKMLQENLSLKDKLQEMELQLSQNKVELERLRQVRQVLRCSDL